MSELKVANIEVNSLNGGQLAGMRNKVINGAFQINQRLYVSGATTVAGQYTLDRWKVTGTGGITFSTTNNKTTVTIPSGQTLQQVIEGLNLQTGIYILSWEGTSQGRIGGGSYGVSGAVTVSIAGGTNTTVEFNSGTVANVQLELGTVATPFEHRQYGQEMTLCQRYYELVVGGVVMPASSGAFYGVSVIFKQEKRASPTVTRVSDIESIGANTPFAEAINAIGFRAIAQASVSTLMKFQTIYAASIEL